MIASISNQENSRYGNIDVSGYTGTHTIKFVSDGEAWGQYPQIGYIDALSYKYSNCFAA